MRLIRGWERRYLPDEIGGVRLSKARRYRETGEEDGIGDRREGEIRLRVPVNVSVAGETLSEPRPEDATDRDGTEHGERHRAPLDADDDLLIELRSQDGGEWEGVQHLRVDDRNLDSPFLFCLSREPTTQADWDRLRAALPKRYDSWTVTDDLHGLKFEIECGLKRWMGINEITEHELGTRRGFVSYPYDSTPPSRELREVAEEEVRSNDQVVQEEKEVQGSGGVQAGVASEKPAMGENARSCRYRVDQNGNRLVPAVDTARVAAPNSSAFQEARCLSTGRPACRLLAESGRGPGHDSYERATREVRGRRPPCLWLPSGCRGRGGMAT